MTRYPKLWIAAFSFSTVAFAGCTNEENLGDRGSAPASSGVGGTATGTIAGNPFTPLSGYAHIDEYYEFSGSTKIAHPVVDLIFSSESDSCSQAHRKKVTPRATFVQVYGSLPEPVEPKPGSYTSKDTKIAIIDPTCVSGAPLTASYAARATADGATVTLTRVDSTLVEGTVSVTFDDGSSFAGSFSLRVCDAALDEKSVCE